MRSFGFIPGPALRGRLERASKSTNGALEFGSSGLVDALHLREKLIPVRRWSQVIRAKRGSSVEE